MKQTDSFSWYSPLAPYFCLISNAMPAQKFAEIEAVLYLMIQSAPTEDAQKAYLLFSQYHLIGTTSCTPLEHQLQCARISLGHYGSKKRWQDDLKKYRDDKYSALRAFSLTQTDKKLCVTKSKENPPYSYENRLLEWERFWNFPKEAKHDLPIARTGRYSYYYVSAQDGESQRVTVEFSQKATAESACVESPDKELRDPITITIDELLQCAQKMATIRPDDYCYRILQQNTIKAVNNGCVSTTTDLKIAQVINIVGMVGSGKSTLIKVLAFWAQLHQKRMVIVVDTVTEVFNLWQYLDDLGVDCAPLIGRRERLKYINQIVQSDKTCLPDQLSQYLTSACLLDGMDSTREESISFGREPCYDLHKDRRYLCPYFNLCSGSRMLRECYSKSVVITTAAGFALSRVGKNQGSFLDVVLNKMDFVIFDESDRIQKTLDQLFMPETSFDKYIHEGVDEHSNYMRLSIKMREENRAVQYYNELQSRSVTVMDCILKALHQDLGHWNTILYGDSFSALTLLEDLHADATYKISDPVYRSLYSLIDSDSSTHIANSPLAKVLSVSCSGTDFELFDLLYRECLNQEKDTFIRPKESNVLRIQDSRIKLILCLIYFDHFIRDLSDAYEACHETSYGQNELFSFLQTRFQEQQKILPSALSGNLFGLKKTDGDDIILFRQFAFGRSLMKDLPYLRTSADGQAAGPHVILFSGSSWAEGSYEYHINRPVNYILEASPDKRKFLEKNCFFESGFPERVSGSGEEKKAAVLRTVTQKTAKLILNEHLTNPGKILLVVNSYAQAKIVQETLESAFKLAHCDLKICRMVSDTVDMPDSTGTIRRGEVSKFANAPENILIAPAMAIERGHNIVDETGHSALSAVFFMVRPMSVPDDIQERGSKLNGYIEASCKRSPAQTIFSYNVSVRQKATQYWAKINGRKPHGLSTLDKDSQTDIVATLFILILQIFGRLARVTDTSRPAPHVYFIDGAFRRPEGKPSDFDCLESLGRYLDALMASPENSEVARTLYEPFYKAYKGGISYEPQSDLPSCVQSSS